jgi:hypothetical protein
MSAASSAGAALAGGERPMLALVQLVQSLWADELQTVYAVVLGSRVPGLRERLADADAGDWDSLWSGELEPGEVDTAPHLVQLHRDSPFSAWLAAEAAAGFGDWGVFVRSKLPFLAMRTAGRQLCQASLPDGEPIRLDWADPAVLTTLLPLAPPMQLARVFKDIDSIVVAGSAEWTQLAAPLGRLQVQRSGVLAGA